MVVSPSCSSTAGRVARSRTTTSGGRSPRVRWCRRRRSSRSGCWSGSRSWSSTPLRQSRRSSGSRARSSGASRSGLSTPAGSRPAGAVPQSKIAAKARPRSRRGLYLIVALVVLVAGVCLCADRQRSGDMYLLLFSGRYVVDAGPVGHDPFPTIEHGADWLNQQGLSEVSFYGAYKAIGITGITMLYAIVLALPLGIALALVRRKSAAAMALLVALYVPGLFAIIHPRAAGFTLVIFALLLAAVAIACELEPARGRIKPGWALASIPPLFALWANLHGGFIAGLALIALLVAGLAIDRWRRIPGTV